MVMAKAATLAMVEVTEQAKAGGRAAIAAAGGRFGQRWSRAVAAKVFPKPPRVSLKPAGLVWVKSDYFGVFEKGASISGKPFLFLPLKSAPSTIGRSKKLTPDVFRKEVGPLLFLRRPGGKALLMAKLDPGKARGDRRGRDVSLPKLRRGARMQKGFIWVPIFVGVPRVKIPKKTNVLGAIARATTGLPAAYFKNLKDQ